MFLMYNAWLEIHRTAHNRPGGGDALHIVRLAPSVTLLPHHNADAINNHT